MQKYLNYYRLVEREGHFYIHLSDYWITEEPESENYIDMSLFPDVFPLYDGKQPDGSPDGPPRYTLKDFFQGPFNMPLYEIIDGKPVKLDPRTVPLFSAYLRRMLITTDLKADITYDTEHKKTRRALVAMMNILLTEEQKENEDIASFLELSDYIDSRIADAPKEDAKTKAREDKLNQLDSDWWWTIGE